MSTATPSTPQQQPPATPTSNTQADAAAAAAAASVATPTPAPVVGSPSTPQGQSENLTCQWQGCSESFGNAELLYVCQTRSFPP